MKHLLKRNILTRKIKLIYLRMHVKMYVQTNTETFILHDDNDKMMKKKTRGHFSH